MYGWRGRIGYISPSPNDAVGADFYKVVPDGVVLVSNALRLQQIHIGSLEIAWQETLQAARDLADQDVDLICSAGDPIYTLRGYGADREMIEKIEAETGTAATTTLTAAMEALRALRVTKVAVATPYPAQFSQLLGKYLEASGFQVLTIAGYMTPENFSNRELARLSDAIPYQVARKAVKEAPRAEGVYMPCARWPAIHVAEVLERDLGIPVVTSAQAFIWKGLKTVGVREVKPGFGSLLQKT